MSKDICFLRVNVNGALQQFKGRFAWTLAKLIAAGNDGISSLSHPAPRLSHYVMVLRRAGVEIETVPAKHGGTFAGSHGIYVLRSSVNVLEMREAA